MISMTESERRCRLYHIQIDLQRIWDKMEYLMWFHAHKKDNQKKIELLQDEYDNMEIEELKLLRPGTLAHFCTACGVPVWDDRFYFESRPFCSVCRGRIKRKPR